jgi:hypothetical protein
VTPISESIFSDSSRFVGVKVNPNAEFSPRTKLVSSAYSFRVASVDGAVGGNILGGLFVETDFLVGGTAGFGTAIPLSPFVVQGSSNWGVAEIIGEGTFAESSIGFRPSNLNKGDSGTFVLGVNNNAGLPNAFSLYVANGLGAGSQAISVLKSGNVGIGNFDPAYKLDVSGIVNATDIYKNGAPLSGVSQWTTSGSNIYYKLGNVGIGISSPAAKLHVHDSTNSIGGSRLTLTQAAQGTTIFDGLATISSPSGGYLWNYENKPLIFGTNNVERIRVDSTGMTGFGLSTPTARVHAGSVGSEGTPTFIAGTHIASQATNPDNWTHMAIISGSLGQARLNFGDGFNDDQGSVAYNNATDAMIFIANATERMRISSTGNVGIGQAGPTHPLHMGSGAHCTAGGTWTNASSRVLKFDIEPLEDEEYSRILRELDDLEVVRFRYKSEPDVEHIGMIAEDVPAEIASPDRKGIPTADAIAFLMAAVKAQQAKFDIQTAKQQMQIEELQLRIKQLSKEN